MSTRTSSEDAPRLGDGQLVDDETPDTVGAFPRLTDDQITTLETGGTRRSVHAGEVLIRAGTRSSDFFVVLTGKVAIIDEGAEDGERRILRLHGPGRFLGELGLLEGQVAFFTAEAIENGEVLVVPAERVRELVAHDLVLSDLILRAYLIRRHLLIGLGAGFRIIGSCYSPDTLRLREFAMPQPAAPQMDRSGARRTGGAAAAKPGCRPRGHSRRDLARRESAAQSDEPRTRPHRRAPGPGLGPGRSEGRVRPRRRGCRTGGSGRVRVRLIRRVEHGDTGVDRCRWAG